MLGIYYYLTELPQNGSAQQGGNEGSATTKAEKWPIFILVRGRSDSASRMLLSHTEDLGFFHQLFVRISVKAGVGNFIPNFLKTIGQRWLIAEVLALFLATPSCLLV